MADRVRLGDLLLDAGIISPEDLEAVLERQRQDGRRLGTLLVEAGLVSETQVTQILSQQLSVPWVSLYHVEFSRPLLELVSQQLAEQHRLVPIFVRRIRGLGNTLYVAMEDPTNEQAREAIEKYAGLAVRTMIAAPSDIASAIRVYYGSDVATPFLSDAEAELDSQQEDEGDASRAEDEGAEDAEQMEADGFTEIARPAVGPAPPGQAARSPVPHSARQGETPAQQAPSDGVVPAAGPGQLAHAGSEGAPGATDGLPDDAPELEYREIELAEQRRSIAERSAGSSQSAEGRPLRTITLTLLDGTTVTLPAPGGGKQVSQPELEQTRWTARDLVVALRAVSNGAEAAEVLGEDIRWEDLFAALLTVLMNKHLVADWEFVDAYRKQVRSKPP
jgi:type IV pilus assembly protein PilB